MGASCNLPDAGKGASLYQILLQGHMQVKCFDFYIASGRAYSAVSITLAFVI
jgi:hypothetical protein